MKTTFYMLFAIAVALSLVLAGCCGATGGVSSSGAAPAQAPATTSNNGVSPSSASPASSGSAPKNIEDGQVGTTYQVSYLGSNYEITMLNATFADSTNPYASGHYLMAYFEIKNIGTGNELFAPDIYALDASGEKYDKTIALGLSDEYSKTLDFFKKLGPNTKTSGWVAIDVPESVTSVDLYFEYTNMYLSKTPNYIKYHVSG